MIWGGGMKWSGSRWLWEKEKWWTSVLTGHFKSYFSFNWAHSEISQAESFCIYFYLAVYWLQGRLLAAPSSSSHWTLNWSRVSWLKLSVSLFLFWEQERCCGEESGPDHSGKVTADGGRLDSQQADCQGQSEPYSRQLPSALEKEARQAGPGGAVSEAEGGKDTTARHRQALSCLSMPAWVVTKVLGSWHFSLSEFMGDYFLKWNSKELKDEFGQWWNGWHHQSRIPTGFGGEL